MKRRINIPGKEQPSATSVASSVYEEVLNDILHHCFHQVEYGKCSHCLAEWVSGLSSLMICEARVRKAINRLLAYQKDQIKKTVEDTQVIEPGSYVHVPSPPCNHQFSRDGGPDGRLYCIRCGLVIGDYPHD